jgi:outer membrane receptor protein involved in Fe transport
MASAVRTWSDRSFIEELRLVSDTGSAFDYVVGLWYQDQNRDSGQDSFLRGFERWIDAAGLPLAPNVTGDQDFYYRFEDDFTETAVYGELTWHITDRVDVTGGLRWFDNDSTNHSLINLPLFDFLDNLTAATFKTSDDDTLFKGNVAIHVGDDDLVYATYSEGYRRGGANAVPTTGFFAESADWLTYTSDSVDNYEIGIKGTLAGMRYDLSAYQVDWNDPQLNTATPSWGYFVVANGESAESKGIELQLSGNIGDSVSWAFGWAYTDATLTADFVVPDVTFGPVQDPGSIQDDGTRLPGAPENTLNASLDWRTGVMGDKEFIVHLDGYYQSETRNSMGDPTTGLFNVPLDAFQIWGTAFTLAADRWNASLWFKNIFNEEGVTGKFTEAYMGTAPDQGYFGNGAKDLISLPRTIGLSFNYNF